MTTPWKALTSRARRTERGSTIVEAAIIIPLLILLTFGAIEFGIAFRDSADVASSTRAGARIASTLTAADDATFAPNISGSVAGSLKDLTHANPQILVVYHADSNGNPLGGTLASGYSGCTDCFRYTWNATAKSWTYLNDTNSWTQVERLADACARNLPSVGVYVRATQPFITGLFGSTKTYDHKTVMRLEPVDADQC